jgi:hypothetical protein
MILLFGIDLIPSIDTKTVNGGWVSLYGCFALGSVVLWRAWKEIPSNNYSYTITINKVKKEVLIQTNDRKGNRTSMHIAIFNELQSIDIDYRFVPCYTLCAKLKNTEAMKAFFLPSLELCNEILAEIRQLMPQEHLILENSTDT